MIRDVSLTLRSGEITGVYGFMGCGQVELAARAVRQGRTDRRAVHARRQAGEVPLDRGGAERRHRLSAGEPRA